MYVTKRDYRTKYYIEFSIQPLSQACLVEIIPSTYRQYNVRSMKKKKIYYHYDYIIELREKVNEFYA